MSKTEKVCAIELTRVNFIFVVVEDLPQDQSTEYLDYLGRNGETCASLPEYPIRLAHTTGIMKIGMIVGFLVKKHDHLISV